MLLETERLLPKVDLIVAEAMAGSTGSSGMYTEGILSCCDIVKG